MCHPEGKQTRPWQQSTGIDWHVLLQKFIGDRHDLLFKSYTSENHHAPLAKAN